MIELMKLLELGVDLVDAGQRPDLRRRLEQTRERLLDPSVRVIVVGEFKQGKSQLVNALVNAPVCPVDDDIATSVPTVVKHGDTPSAVVLIPGVAKPDGEVPIERRPVELDDLTQYVSESGNPGNHRQLVAAEVTLPRKVLTDGLSIVDSPGLGGLSSAHSLTTLTALPTADVVLLVSDASQEYTEPEIQFLRQAMRICPNVACVLSKVDLYPQWREVERMNREHLDLIDRDIAIFPVSADLRLHALRTEDEALNAESGYPALITHLRHDILGQSERLQRRSVGQDLVSIAEHLRLSLQSELSALLDPESSPALIAELETTKSRVDELRRRSSRWQTTLNDGISDLIADMEHDLRDRMRSIQRDAERAIDAADPGPIWDETTEWMRQRTGAAVSDTFIWTDERTQWLSDHVASLFAKDKAMLPVLFNDTIDDVLEPVQPLSELDSGRLGVFQKALIGMRGSYGGVLMIGLLTGIMGLSLINPFSVGAGIIIGTKVYRDEMGTRLKRRQAEAKTLVRSHLDEVVFQVGKQLKDRLRLVQRTTRDHFIDIADQHQKSLGDSVLAAQHAATAYSLERDQRVADIRAKLKQIGDLHRQASELEPRPAELVPA